MSIIRFSKILIYNEPVLVLFRNMFKVYESIFVEE